MMIDSFVCSVCGKTHAGLPTDQAYKLPDDVWNIPEAERSERAKFTRDLCQFGNRYFIRSILEVPFTEATGDFGWGIWVEVEWPVFERYVALYEADGSAEPVHAGKIANAIPGYDEALGLIVLLQFRTSTQRPTVYFAPDAASKLAIEQRQGIDSVRYHEILAVTR